MFLADINKSSALVEDHFSLLSPENRHAASPRLTPDQETVVYFDNPLSTSYGYLIPGPQEMSRRLIKFNLHDAVTQSKNAFQKGILGIEVNSAKVVVEQVMDPETMLDGRKFFGLYPKFPLPERCFSNDHVMYFTIKQLGTLKSIAIDINTNQVCVLHRRSTYWYF